MIWHLSKLYGTTKGSCRRPREPRMLAWLLIRTGTVYHTDNGNVGRIALIEHKILVKQGNQPIRLTSHRLKPEREAKAEEQVQDLLTKRNELPDHSNSPDVEPTNKPTSNSLMLNLEQNPLIRRIPMQADLKEWRGRKFNIQTGNACQWMTRCVIVITKDLINSLRQMQIVKKPMTKRRPKIQETVFPV